MARLIVFTGAEKIPFGYPNDEILAQAIDDLRHDFTKQGGSYLSMTTGGDGEPIKAGLLWVPSTVMIAFEFDGPLPKSLSSELSI